MKSVIVPATQLWGNPGAALLGSSASSSLTSLAAKSWGKTGVQTVSQGLPPMAPHFLTSGVFPYGCSSVLKTWQLACPEIASHNRARKEPSRHCLLWLGVEVTHPLFFLILVLWSKSLSPVTPWGRGESVLSSERLSGPVRGHHNYQERLLTFHKVLKWYWHREA